MSRRGRSSAPRASWAAVVVLSGAVIVLGAALWRIYPDYQRLRSQQTGTERLPGVPAGTAGQPEPIVAKIYLARIVEGQQRLVAIERELPAGRGPARAALEELIEGEVPRGCDRPLPRGTILLGVRASGGVVTADLSREIKEGFRGGSDNEGVTVYGVVNTLASLPSVEAVQILVEGERVDSIGGHLDISGPLRYDGELVVSGP